MVELPLDWLGGEAVARALAARFYEVMAETEPELLALHELGPDGRVSDRTRARFELFFVEWLGGPKQFSEQFGHPRLRMRHARVPIGTAERDSWMRCMKRAMDDLELSGDARVFVEDRLSQVADFLRNQAG
jgi:hemoglobin